MFYGFVGNIGFPVFRIREPYHQNKWLKAAALCMGWVLWFLHTQRYSG